MSVERRERVRDIRAELRILKEDRHRLYKKYSKASTALQNVSVALGSLAAAQSTAGIVTSFTVVGLPVGVVLTSLGVASGVVAAVLTPITKHCVKKKMKHARKHSALVSGSCILDKKISKALDDNVLSDEEFREIVNEYERISKEDSFIEKVKEQVREEIVRGLQ